VIIFSPHSNSDVILLDTVTGQTWFQVQFSDVKGKPLGWEPMQVAQ
jgi:hypothetical protein